MKSKGNQSASSFNRWCSVCGCLDIYLTVNPSALTSDNNEEPGSRAARRVQCEAIGRLHSALAPPTRSRSPAQRANETKTLPPPKPPRRTVSKKSQLLLSDADCSRPLAASFGRSHEWIAEPAGARPPAVCIADYLLNSIDAISSTPRGNFQWPVLSRSLPISGCAGSGRSGALSPYFDSRDHLAAYSFAYG